jgi:hypothetical protein
MKSGGMARHITRFDGTHEALSNFFFLTSYLRSNHPLSKSGKAGIIYFDSAVSSGFGSSGTAGCVSSVSSTARTTWGA